MTGDLKAVISKYRSQIKDPDIFFAPDIPARKLRNALKSYARGAEQEEPLLLIDTSIFGGAKRGLVLTRGRICAKNLALTEIATVRAVEAPPGKLYISQEDRYVEGCSCRIYLNDLLFLNVARIKRAENMRLFTAMLKEVCAACGAQSQAVSNADASGIPIDLSRTTCLSCKSSRLHGLIFIEKEGEPPGHPSHNIVYRHILVVQCLDCGRGQVDRRKHDCFDFEEVWDQDEQYALTSHDTTKLASSISACTDPLSPSCGCAVHESLRANCLAPETFWNPGLEDVPRMRVEIERDFPKLNLLTAKVSTSYPGGEVKAEGDVLDGWLEGHWTVWHPDGQKKAEGDFRNDRRTGQWTEWDEQGKVIAAETFKDGYKVAP